MGLQINKTIVIAGGLTNTVNNSYAKIVQLNVVKPEASITVGYFGAKGSETPFKTEVYVFEPNITGSENYYQQAYLYLKTLPIFNNATDLI